MSAKARKPMSFDVDRSPLTPIEAAPPSVKQAAPVVERQQVGARIPVQKYRQLKAHAALQGVSVQTVVEEAIDLFLTKKN
jgi:hypothetical protein